MGYTLSPVCTDENLGQYEMICQQNKVQWQNFRENLIVVSLPSPPWAVLCSVNTLTEGHRLQWN